MSIEENKAFIRRYVAAISGKDKTREMVEEFISDEHLIDHIMMYEAAFPRYELIEEDLIAEGDKVALRGMCRMTQLGEFMGIPPSGKTTEFAIHITYRIENGKIAENWMLTDNLTAMQQLGALPAPAAS